MMMSIQGNVQCRVPISSTRAKRSMPVTMASSKYVVHRITSICATMIDFQPTTSPFMQSLDSHQPSSGRRRRSKLTLLRQTHLRWSGAPSPFSTCRRTLPTGQFYTHIMLYLIPLPLPNTTLITIYSPLHFPPTGRFSTFPATHCPSRRTY